MRTGIFRSSSCTGHREELNATKTEQNRIHCGAHNAPAPTEIGMEIGERFEEEVRFNRMARKHTIRYCSIRGARHLARASREIARRQKKKS